MDKLFSESCRRIPELLEFVLVDGDGVIIGSASNANSTMHHKNIAQMMITAFSQSNEQMRKLGLIGSGGVKMQPTVGDMLITICSLGNDKNAIMAIISHASINAAVVFDIGMDLAAEILKD